MSDQVRRRMARYPRRPANVSQRSARRARRPTRVRRHPARQHHHRQQPRTRQRRQNQTRGRNTKQKSGQTFFSAGHGPAHVPILRQDVRRAEIPEHPHRTDAQSGTGGGIPDLCPNCRRRISRINPYKMILDPIHFPGMTVLDPFAGGGSILRAAILRGCKILGCEISEERFPVTIARRVPRLPNAFPLSPAPYKLAIVGEAPGPHELAQGRPFAGPTPGLLSNALQNAGVLMSNCFRGYVC